MIATINNSRGVNEVAGNNFSSKDKTTRGQAGCTIEYSSKSRWVSDFFKQASYSRYGGI